MNFVQLTILFGIGLFVSLFIAYEFGWHLGRAKLKRAPEGLAKGVGAAEGAIFGLLGLILAFSFYGAGGRFEDRRHLITQEANAIGTAYLRLEILSNDDRRELKDLFRKYTDLRAITYTEADDNATKVHLSECVALQNQIWSKAAAACFRQNTQASIAMVVLPALNEMIDITTTREMATRNHPPKAVLLLLVSVCLVSALLLGYDTSLNKHRSPLFIIAFALVMSLAIYVTVELEYPSHGLIRVDDANQILVELRQSMN